MPFIEFFARKEPCLAGLLAFIFSVVFFQVIFLLVGYEFAASLFFSLIFVIGIFTLAGMILWVRSVVNMIVEIIKQRYHEWKSDNKIH